MDALLDQNPNVNLQDSVRFLIVHAFLPNKSHIYYVLRTFQYGETALIFACKMRNLHFVERLLDMRANPDIYNNVS